MEVAALVEGLECEGHLLADSAALIDFDAPVPSCPAWTVRDLVRHVGGVHHWAAMHVREPRATVLGVDDLETLFGSWPDDASLVDWYRGEHAALVKTLRSAPADLDTVAFLPADSPLHFWARRQAHEATTHRVDVQLAAGAVSPIDPVLAADAIDEMLFGFAARSRIRFRSTPAKTVLIAPTDAADKWTLTVSDAPLETSRAAFKDANCVVSGTASDIDQLLWNRLPVDAGKVSGEVDLLRKFKSAVRVTWN
jgi:uncharacterized protein (TIGR03083 family)